MIIRNLVDFENQIRKALVRLPAGSSSAGYLQELELIDIGADIALIRLPRTGRLVDHIFQNWVEKDLSPALNIAFEHAGHQVRGVRVCFR